VIREIAGIVKAHRLNRNLRQLDLSEKSGVPLATLRRFERTGQIGLLGLARLLVSLGLVEHLISSFQKPLDRPRSMKDFFAGSAAKPPPKRARQRLGTV
jgi:transcriptional regulator with XRE-family HTH domain